MVVPLPAMMFNMVPSNWTLQKRPCLVSLCAVQIFVAFIRVWPRLDIQGGFFLFCTGILGFYCCREKSVDLKCLPFYAFICLLNGIFDFVFLVELSVRSRLNYFIIDPCLPYSEPGQCVGSFFYNFVHFILLLGPVTQLSAAYLSWKMCRDSEDTQFGPLINQAMPEQAVDGAQNYGTTAGGERAEVFGGEGHALGAGTSDDSSGAGRRQRISSGGTINSPPNNRPSNASDAAPPQRPSTARSPSPGSPGFKPFEGQGQTLGNN